MYELKKMERYLRENLLAPDPRLVEIEFTGSHKGSETLLLATCSIFTHAQKTVVGFIPRSDLYLCTEISSELNTSNKSFNEQYASCLCRSRWTCGLWRRPSDCWDCWFESRFGHECLYLVCLRYVDPNGGLATSWALVQAIPWYVCEKWMCDSEGLSLTETV
jgi:hypothetical protein